MKKGKVTYAQLPEVMVPDLPPVAGKAYRNKITGVVIHGPVYLGKVFFKNNKKLATPIIEKPEDYELVDVEED